MELVYQFGILPETDISVSSGSRKAASVLPPRLARPLTERFAPYSRLVLSGCHGSPRDVVKLPPYPVARYPLLPGEGRKRRVSYSTGPIRVKDVGCTPAQAIV